MNKLSKLLIEFYSTKDINALGLSNNDYSNEMFGVVLHIIEWLRLEYKRSQWIAQGKTVIHRPLELPSDLNIGWVKAMIILINENELMNQYFEVINNQLNFKSNISEEEKDTIRKEISDNVTFEPHYYRKADNVN